LPKGVLEVKIWKMDQTLL